MIAVQSLGHDVGDPLRQQVLALDAVARDVDGVPALDDQVRLDLGARHDSVRHFVARRSGSNDLVGYGSVDVRARKAMSGHLVVAPGYRRQGAGTALLEALTERAAEGPLRVWAHGDTPDAQAFSRHHGFARVRELRQMRRSLAAALPAPSSASPVTVRTFVPGLDDEAWVAVNAASFRDHPEQGGLSVDGLRRRLAQPWFDPAGFFLAERDGELVGYHWTKVHPSGGAGGGPIGEVYVLGVHPDAQGLGLGTSLTLTGLRHLRDRGLAEVMLYVDGDNPAALSVYERLGFTTWSVDAMYAPGTHDPDGAELGGD